MIRGRKSEKALRLLGPGGLFRGIWIDFSGKCLQFGRERCKIRIRNAKAAGHGGLEPRHVPMRVSTPLNTTVETTAPRSYYTCVSVLFQGRKSGFNGVLCACFLSGVEVKRSTPLFAFPAPSRRGDLPPSGGAAGNNFWRKET